MRICMRMGMVYADEDDRTRRMMHTYEEDDACGCGWCMWTRMI